MDRTKILIDCDPGHDDAVAILYAARHCELLGISTVHGNQTLERTTRNALALCELAGIDVPVARGCERPLVGAPVHAGEVHGETGLDGATLPPPKATVVDAHAVDFIIDLARRHRGELVLAVIGPQTNVALALRREPRLASWLRAVTIMGGSTTGGNITAAAEFNVFADPEAAAIVFGCGAPIRMVGLNVTRDTGVSQADIDRLRASGRKVAGVAAGFLQFYLDRHMALSGNRVASMHDVCAIVPFARPDLIGFRETSVRVELTGTHTRGMTLCDMRGLRPANLDPVRAVAPANAEVATSVRADDLIADVVKTILGYD